jgi:hypothetical protein
MRHTNPSGIEVTSPVDERLVQQREAEGWVRVDA